MHPSIRSRAYETYLDAVHCMAGHAATIFMICRQKYSAGLGSYRRAEYAGRFHGPGNLASSLSGRSSYRGCVAYDVLFGARALAPCLVCLMELPCWKCWV